ncbi:MAG: hypothetical protein JNM52_02580, partial [Betaproteobacteria bacterium]|nr:hypothetical protein [Betaproteobacteria bacterium]
MPHLPVTQRLLLAALLMWLTTASAEAPTRPPLRAPAGQCSVISEVNGEVGNVAVVGDKVTFTAFCVAL